MLVTIAINTWNRCKLLDATLAQLGRLDVPAGVRTEIIVVDNNSSDATRQVVDAHTARLPVTYVFEPRQGTSFAKNAAVERAAGELTLWTDDDVLVDPGWVRAYLDAAAAYPAASFFGGTIRPWYGATPPAWIPANLDLAGCVWALLDLGPGARPLADPEDVYGANMGFRTAALKEYRFDTGYGDVGGRVRKGEETHLMRRMRKDGHVGVWVGGAVVEHYILPERLNAGYVRRLIANYNYQAYDPAEFAGLPRLAGVPRYLFRKHLTARARAAVLSPGRSREWLLAHLEAARTAGQITAARAGRHA